MSKYVLCSLDGPVATVTMNRPTELNALNEEVLVQLFDQMCELNADKKIRAVILTGSGEKAFAAGADIGEMRHMDRDEAERFSAIGHSTMDRIASMRPFMIAAVNGYALGGGCELAMACDIRIASRNARMGIPEATLGVIPGFGGTQRLPRLVGSGIAMEMLATGAMIDADEALRTGLVNHLADDREELMEICNSIARKVAKNSASAIYCGKKAMKIGEETGLAEALRFEQTLFAGLFGTTDQMEGMDAFMEKRKAVFDT